MGILATNIMQSVPSDMHGGVALAFIFEITKLPLRI